MNWFPQTGAGSIAQFPLRRLRTWRGIANDLESGERIVLPDAGSGQIEWHLSYKDLSDAEAKKLTDLFAASFGRYGAFGFIDPLANLIAWSEDLSRPDWQAGLLAKTGGVNDPNGTQKAWSVSNSSPGDQQLTQTLAVPGDYVACFSAWVRSDAAGSVNLQRDNVQATVAIGPVWRRVLVSGAGTSGALSSNFSVVVQAGRAIQVWGMQVEVQPYASQYKPSSTATGIYEETYFGEDQLAMSNTGVGLTACEIVLLSRV